MPASTGRDRIATGQRPSVITEPIQFLYNHLLKTYGKFPDDYVCIDTETTGFKRGDDLIWNFGACIVKDRQPVQTINLILNWWESPFVDHNWLDARIRSTREAMRANGRECHLSKEVLASGITPEIAMEEFGDILLQSRADNVPIVGHGLVKFDVPRISQQLEEWIGLVWRFRRNQVIDTAAIEKAAEAGMNPQTGEVYFDFVRRVLNKPLAGVRWNLDTACVKKYNLLEKCSFKHEDMHSAATDSVLCHLVLEEHRKILGV